MRYYFITLLLLFGFTCASQNDDVLVTINDDEIRTEEFIRVFEKNRSIITDSQSQSPAEYLELYIDYKLKVQEAFALGYHNNPTYIKELKNYRDQLAKKFITNTQVTDELVREAYDRLVTEINARHILIAVPKEGDTLQAYNDIINARIRIVKGEDFTAVAKEVSEDPSVKDNGGELGWFKALKMVYPFENAAYNTEIGDISYPFRSQFGYHIVQPTAIRKAEGSVKVAHIMITLNQTDNTISPKDRINEVYTLLKNGDAFDSLAKIYSDDKRSSVKGGLLQPIERGQFKNSVFEEKAFALKEVGTISSPFETRFGWHIVKLIEKKSVPTFDKIKKNLIQKVTRDARSQVVDKTLRDKLRLKYGVEENNALITYFTSFSKTQKKEEEIPEDDLSKIAFTLNDTKYTYLDVYNYLKERANSKGKNYKTIAAFVNGEVNRFIDTRIKEYHLANLEKVDPEFNLLLKEYQEGLLLFDLLETNIWNVASKDTLGLQSYFALNNDKYKNKNLEEIKGKVISDYQKSIETSFLEELRSRARITKNKKVLKKLTKKYRSK